PVTTNHWLSPERPQTVSAVPVESSPIWSPWGRSYNAAPPPRTTATMDPAVPTGAVTLRPTGVAVGLGVGVGVGVGLGVGEGVGVGVDGGVAVGVGSSTSAVAPGAAGAGAA